MAKQRILIGPERPEINFCMPGIMSRCSAGIVWENQKKCKFSKKSSVSERCMHFIPSLDGHCDSADAQRER